MKAKNRIDFYSIATVVILFLIGLFIQYSTTPLSGAKSGWTESLVVRQTLFAILSLIVTWIITSVDPQIGKTLLFQALVWIVSVLLLGGLFVFGPIVNETHRWYQLGVFLFQPSEFVKIALILWSAFWLSHAHVEFRRLSIGIVGLVVGLGLILLQPDFGATIIIMLSITTMLIVWSAQYTFGRRMLLFLGATGLVILIALKTSLWVLTVLLFVLAFMFAKVGVKEGIIALSILLVIGGFGGGVWYAWATNHIPDYVKTRIEDFTSQNVTHQVRQSKIAIGSGQLGGKGIAQGTQTRLRFLPEYTTDFIFAAFVEERGFIGILVLLLLYLFLYGRFLYFAVQTEDEYARLLIIGLTMKLWFETFVNIGMNMGIMPTKGVALPFLSYGGSSLLANTIIVGIILTLYRHEGKRDTI